LVYEFNDFLYIHDYGKARLYKGNHLLFKGNAWSGILQFLNETDNAPEVRAMFKAQLEQREKIKYKVAQKEKVVDSPKVSKNPTPPPPKPTKKKSIWDDNRRMTK
jgi:hypothetical protein